MTPSTLRRLRRLVALGLAPALWLPALAGLVPDEPPTGLEAAELAAWTADAPPSPSTLNPEWDLMTRMFTVLGLSDRVVSAPGDMANQARIAAIDRILDLTRAELAQGGSHRFLLPYARSAPFRFAADRSLFVDGELALMLAARHLASPEGSSAERLRAVLARVTEQLEAGPIGSGESYPDECWTFCNTTALAALRLGDVALGSDHGATIERWLAEAKARLLDPQTGLLISSYTLEGERLQGPEGSTLWMSLHNLRLVDPDFAHAQYRLARGELAIEVAGFGFAREWPRHGGGLGFADVDSGPVVPILDASAGSSGLWFLGAASFGDQDGLASLHRSLELFAFPDRDASGLRYRAAGAMGNAVLFAARSVGPLWRLASEQSSRRQGHGA